MSPWSKIVWLIRHRGLRATLGAVLRHQGGSPEKQHPFDALYGTDTGGVIGGASLGSGHAHDRHITAYAGMPPSKFEGALARWLAGSPLAPADTFSFVDLGCGKGRVVLMASQHRFARVIGVELDVALARIAEANLIAWGKAGHALTQPEIVCADATEFSLPEGPCLLYLANPFGAPVLRRLLERIEAGRVDSGPIDLIYQNPAHRGVFEEFPSWQLLWDEAFTLSEEDRAAEPVYQSEDRCVAWRRAAR